jgi:dephospho-CoA kinase
MKKVIGITGSIGSGKSYAVNIFKKICKENEINAIFLDVDDIRRNILRKENIDRTQLNKKIYNDEKAMEEYKKIINPKIKKYLNEQISKNSGVIFIEWALLLEDNLYDIVDSIIMIYCKKQIQIKRLEDGDLGKEAVIKRIEMQLTNEQKIEKIKELNKEFLCLDTSENPKLEEYENLLKKEGLYE